MFIGGMAQYHISDYYHNLSKAIRDDLAGETDNNILNSDSSEFENYLFQKYSLPEIVIDPNRQPEIKSSRLTRNVRDVFGEPAVQETDAAQVEVYLVPDNNLGTAIECEASTWSTKAVEVEYNETSHSISFEVPLDGLQGDIDFIKSTFDKRNAEIIEQNKQLKNTIPALLKERKEKANQLESKLNEVIQKVSLSLKRADVSERPIMDLQVRKNIQDLKKPIAQPNQEFILDRKYILDILGIINLGGKQFELNPEVYGSKLDEEDLRNIILSYLNIIFEGSATGETFCKQGKTDIYLNIPKGQIFIAECKFWSGEQKYKETIDQLFRYLTWRRNYSLIITFAKSADFTQMMESAQQAINSHPTFSKGLEKLENTHFQSIHTFPEDSKKEIEIHHLFFNLYTKQ